MPGFALSALLFVLGVLAIVQGHRFGLGIGILVLAAGSTAMGVSVLRDQAPWLQLDAAGMHYREGGGTALRTVAWPEVVDARPRFERGRATAVRIEVALAQPVTPRETWLHRVLRRRPKPVHSREIDIMMWDTSIDGVRAAETILAYRDAWEEATAAAAAGPRRFRHLIRSDFA